ncbi:hypothetical protein CRUP_013398 [Coryphaenoides rupestris]|nr:hypothetical protein CRUP_013398 [Coryphaenoides rupestris]
MDIPEPSEAQWAEKDRESFLSDPEELWDPRPQPYRMIDELLQGVLDAAWDALPESTHCLACSGDGRFLAVGHAQGLTVSHASSLACVCSWPPEGGTEEEITAIQMRASEWRYRVVRVLAFSAEKLHVLKIINKTEDINQRSVCVTFELSEGGDFAAALMRCNGAVWLDVYHFPLEAWLEDLKQAEAHSQEAWRAAVTQIAGRSLAGGLGSSGLNHMISGRQWGLQDAAFRSSYGFEPWDHQDVRPGLGAAHFLSPCDAPTGSTGEGTAPPGALCLWWTGSHNLLQYPLGKARNKQDAEPRATASAAAAAAAAAATATALTWPNAQEIVCSAVSRNHRYLALGLGPDHVVSVWDRQTDFLVGKPKTCLKRPTDAGRGPTAIAPLAFLRGLTLVLQGNGEMFVVDSVHGAAVCRLMAPTTRAAAARTERSQSRLLVFRFGEHPLFEPHALGDPGPAAVPGDTLERACNHYLRQRSPLAGREGGQAGSDLWLQLQQESV